MKAKGLWMGIFFTLIYSVSVLAANEPPSSRQTRCQALLSKAQEWFQYTGADLQTNRRSLALGSFLMDTISDPRNFRAHYNGAAWESYQRDPKQWARTDASFTYAKEIEVISVGAGQAILDRSVPGWENDAQLLFIYPSPISLYTTAKEALPKRFQMGSLLVVKDGLVRGVISKPAGPDAKYESFE